MKDMGASVLARLKNQAKETGVSYQMCLQLFCQEEFLRRLSQSSYSSNFVLNSFQRIAEFRNNSFLTGQWIRFQTSMQMELPEFSAVLDRLQQFLQPAFDSGIHEKDLNMNWFATQKKWQNDK